MPIQGDAHSRVIVVAHHAICQSSIMIVYSDNDHVLGCCKWCGDTEICTVPRPYKGRDHWKTKFRVMSSMRCFDHALRSYDHTEI